MKRNLIVAEYLATPWALMPERMAAFTALLHRWSAGLPATPEVMANIEASKEAREVRRASTTRATTGGIQVLPLYGVVTQRGNMADDISGPGSVSTQRFASALRDALDDDTVGQILIDIDSPGGSVYGVSELYDEILSARSKKPIVGIANSLAASAAYWIGCACTEFYVTPGGEVGSIGVWQAHMDYSQAMAEEGVKPTLISAGKFKVEGNPYQPLDADAQAFMQSRVNEYYGTFVKAVAKGRKVGVDQVRNGMGEGRVLGADAASAEGMVDGVMTFDQVVSKMQKDARGTQPNTARSRVAAAKRELEIMG
jgi:signal peptide peptidase SppA